MATPQALEEGTGRPGDGGAMTVGLTGVWGGMVHPELRSHGVEMDVPESDSLHPQATKAPRHSVFFLQVSVCFKSGEHEFPPELWWKLLI